MTLTWIHKITLNSMYSAKWDSESDQVLVSVKSPSRERERAVSSIFWTIFSSETWLLHYSWQCRNDIFLQLWHVVIESYWTSSSISNFRKWSKEVQLHVFFQWSKLCLNLKHDCVSWLGSRYINQVVLYFNILEGHLMPHHFLSNQMFIS